jgi:hypothetical protein
MTQSSTLNSDDEINENRGINVGIAHDAPVSGIIRLLSTFPISFQRMQPKALCNALPYLLLIATQKVKILLKNTEGMASFQSSFTFALALASYFVTF